MPASNADEYYEQLLRENGVGLKGKVILDVGCGAGRFVRHARDCGAKESWGVEHSQAKLEEGFRGSLLSESDRPRCLTMPFSDIPQKRPDLKGKFDVIKITAVTPYASAHELERMAHTAHFLLKKDGHVMVELPCMNLMDRAYRADQTTGQSAQAIEAYADTDRSRVRQDIGRLKTAYSQLFRACFEQGAEVKNMGGVPTLLLGRPKATIPAIADIRFDPETLKLYPISGRLPDARTV